MRPRENFFPSEQRRQSTRFLCRGRIPYFTIEHKEKKIWTFARIKLSSVFVCFSEKWTDSWFPANGTPDCKNHTQADDRTAASQTEKKSFWVADSACRITAIIIVLIIVMAAAIKLTRLKTRLNITWWLNLIKIFK